MRESASPEGVLQFSQHEQRFLQSLQKTRNQSSQARRYKPLLSFTVMVCLNTGHTEQAQNPDPRGKATGQVQIAPHSSRTG